MDTTTPADLVADCLMLLVGILHSDEDSIEDSIQWFQEYIQSVESFKEAGVMNTNPGIKFSMRDGSFIHAEFTY